ncbi:MAG: PD-(D/E)XK nuclease family protein, partial [Nanoarchaeota archaeon]
MENIEEKLMELKKKLIEFEENKKYFKQFNIFETLKITNAEIRHSNIFAWLLNPQGSHGLKTKFLKRFIEDINKSSNNPIEFSSKAYQSFKIRREWNFIDLTLIHKEMQSIIIIENKIWSNESDHQLESYQKIIEANYPNYIKKYVYLTPFGEKPSNHEIWQTY